MLALIAALQILLPLLLLVWLLAWPARSASGFVLQGFGVGAFLLALALVAQWAVLPWWLPQLYGGLWLGILLWHLLRGRTTGVPFLPVSVSGWTQLALAFALSGIGTWYGIAALIGRAQPAVPGVDIANPFGPGVYLVGNGGGREVVNAHLRTLDPAIERFRPWRGQSYAVDFFGLNRWGTRAAGLFPADPAAYAIFRAPLYAPCAGEVIAIENERPDFTVPENDQVNRLGNHVILLCDDVWIVLAHMRQGSVAVMPGQSVAVGVLLGEVGNSGASTEPHLHIHAQRPAAPGTALISGSPLALRIDGRFPVRGDRLEGRER